MWPVSDAFKAAVRAGGAIRATAAISVGGVILAASHRPSQVPIRISSGSVTVDGKADNRRRFDLTLEADPSDDSTVAAFDPESGVVSALLRPEVRLYRGMVYGPVESELVPLGVFSLERVTISHGDGVTIQLAGRDRSARIADNPFTDPWTIPNGTNVATAIRQIVENRASGFLPQFAFEQTPRAVPADMTFASGEDPWATCLQLAQDAGLDVWFDAGGVCQLRRVADPARDGVVFSYGPGEGVVMRPTSKSYDSLKTYNGVVAEANAPWLRFAIRGEAWDTNPESQTYYLGPFGKRPMRIQSAAIGVQADADAAAAAEYLKIAGVEEALSFTFAVNPAHEASDVVEITEPALLLDRARFVLDGFTVPLRANEDMPATARRQRAV